MKKEKQYSRRTERDYGWIRTTFTNSFRETIVLAAAKLMYNLKIEGKENIPKTSRLIIAPNHVSYCDPAFVSFAIKKCIAFMAKKELFHKDMKLPIKSKFGTSLLRFLVHTFGAFEVDRECPKPSTFKTVKSVFNTNWTVGIFPEGGIRQDKKIRNIKRGFAWFAKKHRADILPVAVCGFTWYATKLFDKNMTIKIGKPISYELDESEIIREWAKQISEMTGFENLVEQKYKEPVLNIS